MPLIATLESGSINPHINNTPTTLQTTDERPVIALKRDGITLLVLDNRNPLRGYVEAGRVSTVLKVLDERVISTPAGGPTYRIENMPNFR